MPQAVLNVALSIGVVDHRGLEKDIERLIEAQIGCIVGEVVRCLPKADRLGDRLVAERREQEWASHSRAKRIVHRLEIWPTHRLVMETRGPHRAVARIRLRHRDRTKGHRESAAGGKTHRRQY